MKSGEFRHTAFMPVSFRYSVKIAEVSSSPCAMIVRSEVYSRNAPTSLRISSKAAFIRPRASSRCAPSTPSMQVVYLSVNIASWLSTVSRSPAAAAATIFTRASVVPDIADSTVILAPS